MKKLFILLSLFLFLSFLGFWGFKYFLNPPLISSQSFPMVFEVSPGESLTQIALRLKDKRLIQNEKFFLLFLKISKMDKKIKMGEYEMKSPLNLISLANLLSSGKSRERSITIPEGYNIFEIAQIFSDKQITTEAEFLKLIRDRDLIKSLLGENQSSLEGYLFPETYSYTKFTDTKTLLSQMVSKFKDEFKEVGFPKNFPLNPHQIVTLASIIEKETGAPEERPLIASVFLNRLKKGMRLQTDPTVIYGIAFLTGEIPKNIRRTDLQTPNPYNTYTQSGLPPGPISNPGREALQAVLNPASSQYLYFVSKNEGRHFFSETYEKHAQAVKAFQLNSSSREGKSWRQMNKESKAN